MVEVKTLTKSEDQKIAGVCAGIAEYFNIDPTTIRLLWIVITVLTGIAPGLIIYGVAWYVIPEK